MVQEWPEQHCRALFSDIIFVNLMYFKARALLSSHQLFRCLCAQTHCRRRRHNDNCILHLCTYFALSLQSRQTNKRRCSSLNDWLNCLTRPLTNVCVVVVVVVVQQYRRWHTLPQHCTAPVVGVKIINLQSLWLESFGGFSLARVRRRFAFCIFLLHRITAENVFATAVAVVVVVCIYL